ncbi:MULTISPECIES: HD domain-containing protein [Stenotrophomonas]|uniref:HD domain-containing protein n=1 Tax=Stenotrophomonas TaxID=40323 RepID=UPI0008DE145D|nr:HD domain-containing protein [Stenotrophomonas maltophilia]OHY71423.1 hypothetical protein BB780_06035 [Stenotrophomonas maltophilia]
MEWIARARTLATQAHAGQFDKAGQPYIGHVGRVAARVSGDDDAEVVAWLHDVVEDCPGSAAQVQDFPAHIQHAVHLLSRNRSADTDLYYAGIAGNPLALKVKLADIADNADEQRLAALDSATAERLRGKYRHALSALGARRTPLQPPRYSPSSEREEPAPRQRLAALMHAGEQLDAVVCGLDRINAGFREETEQAAALLLFMHDQKVLHSLARVRRIVLLELEAQMELEAYDTWMDTGTPDWTPPYGESAEGILQRFIDTCGPLPRCQGVPADPPGD